jgi:ABC-type lipoprotein release transport system permease subunit
VSPVGKWFDQVNSGGKRDRMQVLGVTGDARYGNMREPIAPTVYLPFRSRVGAAFAVRFSGPDPTSLIPALRRELTQHGFRARSIETQQDLILRHTVRERLLATLALFFAAVAVLLAGIGLYGVLSYSVLQWKRELGIRIAIGARTRHIIVRVTGGIVAMVLAGAAAGCAAGLLSVHYITSLLFQVKGTDPAMLAIPCLTILIAVASAAAPAVLRALRIDPATMLRSE